MASAGDFAVIRRYIFAGSVVARRIKLYQGRGHSSWIERKPTIFLDVEIACPALSTFFGTLLKREHSTLDGFMHTLEKSLLSSWVYFVRIKYTLVKNFINQPCSKIRD
jgi:hypothetical protein